MGWNYTDSESQHVFNPGFGQTSFVRRPTSRAMVLQFDSADKSSRLPTYFLLGKACLFFINHLAYRIVFSIMYHC